MSDLISRQAVNTLVDELARAISDERCCIPRGRSTATIMQDILDLPPVTPQPKTVLYIGNGYADGYMVYDMAQCPNCGYEYEDGDKDWGLSFCPNCGQKLNWERSDHKCHNCKHYTSGERDGSCGSYICKHYSGWESDI